MAQSRNSGGRKKLLSIAKKTPKAVSELVCIRGDGAAISEDFDAYADADRTLRLMKKKKSAFFVSLREGCKSLVLGRAYDSQFLELISFRIVKMLSSVDFPTVPAEISVKYFLLFQNIRNERLENMFMDLLRQQAHEVSLNGVRYAWVFSQTDKLYTLKFVRVMKDLSVEDIGPYFEMEIESEFYCGDELWRIALDVKRSKKRKNVEKTVLKERVGKVHVDKQDLKDIRLKKSRGYRTRAEGRELEQSVEQ